MRRFASVKTIMNINCWRMKKIYLSILMTLCSLLPGMAQQVSQTGREVVGQTGLRASAAQTSKPFLQEGRSGITAASMVRVAQT